MALSQKHAGLLLVPWYNKEEWNFIYHCIYSTEEKQRQKALEILKIWKLRTPILSTGIEGTLIILDVLTGSSTLNSEQLRYIYSVGIMRFLNLSAANSEKQGEFTRLSAKNELPDWLISLRHDIAHGHNMPSLAMLKEGLEFGLIWLKQKYWEPKNQVIKDLLITEKSLPNDALNNALLAYIDIKLNIFQRNDVNTRWLQHAKEMVFKKFKKRLADVKMMIDILEETIRQSLASSQNKIGDEKLIIDILVSEDALLYCQALEKADSLRINEDFRLLWNNLLNILHKHKLLLKLIVQLHHVMCDLKSSDILKSLSALWIKEIFGTLLAQAKDMKNGIESKEDEEIIRDNVLKLDSREFYEEEAQSFQKLTLAKPKVQSQLFLPMLLTYNGNSKTFNEDTLRIIHKKLNASDDIRNVEAHIFTLEDLYIGEHSDDGADLIRSTHIVNNSAKGGHVGEIILGGPRWIKIKDTSSFKKCPLGVLPHQIEEKHPFLAISS